MPKRASSVFVEIDTAVMPPFPRTNLEDGAYLVVDLECGSLRGMTKWRRLNVQKSLIVDIGPTGDPVLVEIRRPPETWSEVGDLVVPEPHVKGCLRMRTTGPVSVPVALTSNVDRTTVRISLGSQEPEMLVRIASGLLCEVTHVEPQGTVNVLRGELVGLWVLDVPKQSLIVSLLRALRVVGPPIGGEAPQRGFPGLGPGLGIPRERDRRH